MYYIYMYMYIYICMYVQGYYSNAGSAECSPCLVNTYSDTTGAGLCKPCNPPGASSATYALPGVSSSLAAFFF